MWTIYLRVKNRGSLLFWTVGKTQEEQRRWLWEASVWEKLGAGQGREEAGSPRGSAGPPWAPRLPGHMAVSSCWYLGPWAPCHRVKPRRDCCLLHCACKGATGNPLTCNLLKQLCWLVDFEHNEGKKHRQTKQLLKEHLFLECLWLLEFFLVSHHFRDLTDRLRESEGWL